MVSISSGKRSAYCILKVTEGVLNKKIRHKLLRVFPWEKAGELTSKAP